MPTMRSRLISDEEWELVGELRAGTMKVEPANPGRSIWPDRIRHCEADAKKGAGTGICGKILDEHGNCPRASNHMGG
jgi:hypothetical protein